MGKHLWRKNSYAGVEKEDPGCVWTVFRLMNYHPWHNVKKMLPYIKEKPHKRSTKSEAGSNEEFEFWNAQEFEDDAMTNYSASVNSSPCRSGSGGRKRSIKARIKALLADKTSKSGKVNTIQEHELLALEAAYTDLGAPTLISLLKANPKLLTQIKPVDEPINLNRATSVKHKDSKEEYVGVLELFKVDQAVFHKIVQDSPKRKHRLMKSGSFPFSNKASQNPSTFGRSPSKLEHKHNEVWPTLSPGHEFRKSKSHNIVSSSSLKESLDRYGHLIDATSNSNKRIMNRNLSKSLKLTNEKDFATLSDLHGRKSFRERMFLPDVESDTPRASLDYFLQNISQGDEVRVVRLESPPGEPNGQNYSVTSAELSYDEKSIGSFGVEQGDNVQQVEIVEVIEDQKCPRNEGLSSISGGLDVDFQHDQIEYVDWPILEGSPRVSHSTSMLEMADDVHGLEAQSTLVGNHEMDYSNENFQYVKYVLDIIGFTTTDDQLESWHSPEQPLDPALFDGIEICCPFEPKQSSKETTMSSSHCKILFDLMNEALFDIHENSYAYYPKALTSNCIVHPESKGRSRVVEQVWGFVREWVEWQSGYDKELNMAMANELSRHKNGWSNLQTDSELLATDLEDWIFDELLDEIVCN